VSSNEIDAIDFEGLDADDMEDGEDHGLFRTRATGRRLVTLEYPDGSYATTAIDLPERSETEIVLGNFERHAPPSEPAPGRTTIGTASIRVTTPGDKIEELCVYIDGEIHQTGPREPEMLIESLSPGPHTLIIGAPDRRQFVHRIVLKRGETRVIQVKLPLRTNE